MSAPVVTLPTRPALRRVLARLDADGADVAALDQVRTMLRTLGRAFVDFADMLPGDDDPLLEPDQPVDYATIRALFDKYERRVPLARLPWLGAFLSRLKSGEPPTIEDRRTLADLRARLRSSREAGR